MMGSLPKPGCDIMGPLRPCLLNKWSIRFLIGAVTCLAVCQAAKAQRGMSLTAVGVDAPASVAGCTLTVTPDKAVFVAGENISLTAVVHNVGPDMIYMPGISPFLSYHLSVKEPDGTDAPKTLFYEGRLHEFIKETRSFSIKPGQSLTEAIDLGRAFDMTQSGIYTVSITRTIGKPPDARQALLLPPVTLKIRVDEDDQKYRQPLANHHNKDHLCCVFTG